MAERSRVIRCKLIGYSKGFDECQSRVAALISRRLEGTNRDIEGCQNMECPWRNPSDERLFEVRMENGEVVECFRVMPKTRKEKGRLILTGAQFATQSKLQVWELANYEAPVENRRSERKTRYRWRGDEDDHNGGFGVISF